MKRTTFLLSTSNTRLNEREFDLAVVCLSLIHIYLAHDVGRDAGVEALETLLAIGEVVEAAVDVRDLGAVLGHCVAPLRLLLGSGGLGLGALLGGLALEGLKAVLVDPGDQRGVVLAHDVALDHNVDAVDIQVRCV